MYSKGHSALNMQAIKIMLYIVGKLKISVKTRCQNFFEACENLIFSIKILEKKVTKVYFNNNEPPL